MCSLLQMALFLNSNSDHMALILDGNSETGAHVRAISFREAAKKSFLVARPLRPYASPPPPQA